MAKKRVTRNWHPDFLEYMDFIVNHPNYEGLAEKHKQDGTIRWIATNTSKIGKIRDLWWEQQKKRLQTSNKAEVARAIYPKELGEKRPCQICGKKLNINYVYPDKNLRAKINYEFDKNYEPYGLEFSEIVGELTTEFDENAVMSFFITLFKIPNSAEKNKEQIIDYILENGQNRLSAGSWGDPPDRFDGFHTYNNCCRGIEDTGRWKENLAIYTQDRRAYEKWADGDYNLANRLMGEYSRFSQEVTCPSCNRVRKMTADHIGPISLGFAHRAKFNPLCRSCNSTKKNRMTYQDVLTLIDDEQKGDNVISWHSKYVWDKLKEKVTNYEEAKRLSYLMSKNIVNVFALFSTIDDAGYRDFLKSFFDTRCSFFDHRFENFHPLRLSELITNSKQIDNVNKRKNAESVLGKAFESLEKYKNKHNRKIRPWEKEEIDEKISEMLIYLNANNTIGAKTKLHEILQMFAEELTQNWEKA